MKTILPILFLFAACVSSGPTQADTQADRLNWQTAHNYWALSAPTEQEHQAAGLWLEAWDQRLRADEAAVGHPRDAQSEFAEIVRIYGSALVQTFLVESFRERAPEAFRLIDKNGDGALAPEEFAGIDWKSPVTAVVVVTTVQKLLRRHR